MTVLASFGDELQVAVVGASGGIGRALTEALAAAPEVTAVHALSRRDPGVAGGKVIHRHLDLEEEDSIAEAAAGIRAEGGAPALVIVASGILHSGPAATPEKTWHALDPDAFARVLAINTIGPALVAKHFLPLQPRERRSGFAVLSARVGSIADNRLGGWYSYRASKAAVNMLVRTLAIELARRNPQAFCVALHPGTVATALSGPFQQNVPAEQLFAPERAAAQLLAVIDARGPADSGGFFAWDGKPIPY